jgi:hypothetical protein
MTLFKEASMKERPIHFSSEMVRAILDGRKTQTRRIIKPQPDIVTQNGVPLTKKTIEVFKNNTIVEIEHPDGMPGRPFVKIHKCPYGQPGDRLWVRETWWNGDLINDSEEIIERDIILYKADEPNIPGWPEEEYKWKPSIHMPRWASRIFLEIDEIRVERVQDITPFDAWNEGCRIGNSFTWDEHIPELQQQCRDILFKGLWDSIYKNWDANPWVRVIKFHKL